MSRFRRPFDQDNLVDAVFDALSSATASGSPEAIRAKAERDLLREKAREERRRRKEAHGWRQLVGAGSGLTTGGLLVLAWPAATIPAVGAGLLAGAAGYYVVKWAQEQASRAPALAARRPREIAPPNVDAPDLPKSRRELVQSVLDDATPALRALDRIGRSLAERDADAAGVCDRLAAAGERLCAAVAEEPAKFELAQRVLTYHLPKAVYVAETFLAPSGELDVAQFREARQVLGRMEMLFEKTLLDLKKVERAEMNLEMRLINQALDEELGVVAPKRG